MTRLIQSLVILCVHDLLIGSSIVSPVYIQPIGERRMSTIARMKAEKFGQNTWSRMPLVLPVPLYARAHATINDYDRCARYSNERQLHEEQLDEETVLLSFS